MTIEFATVILQLILLWTAVVVLFEIEGYVAG